MTTWGGVHLLAASSALVVIALALTQSARNPLRRPLALIGTVQFAWNAAALGSELAALPAYAMVGAIAAPFYPPLALDFVLTFLGRRKQYRWPLRVTLAIFALQSVLAVVELVAPGVFLAHGLKTLALWLLLPSIPLAVIAFGLVLSHLRKAGTTQERRRAQILLFAVVWVTVLLVTDPLADLGWPVPRLATLGSLGFNGLLAFLTQALEFDLRGTRRGVTLGLATLVGLAVGVGTLATFTAFSAQTTLFIVALMALSLVVGVSGWLIAGQVASTRIALERFATLGRFSAQMAHDLKNPLAAAKGATEYLQEELRRKDDPALADFARLVKEQLDRLHAVIDRYQRLSKLEPTLTSFDANALAKRVLSLQHFAAPPGVTIDTSLVPGELALRGDADLLASALENLITNGLEAMSTGGRLTVSSQREGDDLPLVLISVTDTGPGFDARAREQAFELFFTTKAKGSGLGLAFVRQVARAHGGDARLDSQEGRGTTVTLALPAAGPDPQ